jgi:catechol 2,3-dioxygenase-like lactoylglutathione lyase family enzyme
MAMTRESPAKCRCKGIAQVGIAVDDVERVARNYWDILGIGPWTVLDFEAPFAYDCKYQGKSVWTRERIAVARVGNVELELAQPVDGPSVFRDWIQQHGEGLHHLNFLVEDFDRDYAALAGDGFPCIESGRFVGPGPVENRNAHFDVKPLRVIVEPVLLEAAPNMNARTVPAAGAPSPAKVQCTGITQLGIVVSDVELVAKNYWDILGIGPWAVFDWEPPLVYDRTYRGGSVWTRERIAVAQAGSLQLRLLQPVDGPSIYADWLEEHGEGPHHLSFLVDDIDGVSAALANDGFPCIQSGRFAAPEGRESRFAYHDTKPLRAIIEPVYLEGDPDGEVRLVPS